MSTIGVRRMANRRCKICWINLDGGRGYMLQRWDWEKMQWRYAGNICDKCLKRAERAYARNTKVA